ncbi:glyceraldehyde 3-phosphate dehydrogenase NAD-binding domain-containing protein, partial [Corynebacterium sp.]|uniref:glyceraldehyde 3-phosphate dehydrogenase NAD-binding domain-containing protein n=1 Tax=Corynebacterium sp. TaxID=1720 RepID=UPI002A916CA9
MVPLISHLHRENSVATSIYGRLLVGVTDVDVIKAHRYGRRIVERELPLDDTLPILKELTELDLGTASIDLGRLAEGFSRTEGKDLRSYLEEELKDVIGGASQVEPRDVVLYGFGRIGRLLARILVAHEGVFGGVRLRAVVVRKKGDDDIHKRASLLQRDSVHGSFHGTISVDDDKEIIWANGTPIQMIYSDDPTTIDYSSYGINDAILVDNTGRWRDRAGLSQHLEAEGIARVVLTAPGKGDVRNIVYGVN